MFIVFIPWKDCEGYRNLEKSVKLIHKFELKPKNHTLSALLAVMPPDRIKKVEKDIEDNEIFWKTLNNNKCEHVEVIKRFNKAVTQDEYRDIYTQLKTYIYHIVT
jgi:hypothetical protein